MKRTALIHKGRLCSATPLFYNLLLFVAVQACSNDEGATQPASFDRPERMDFVCFDLTDAKAPKPVPLDQCAKKNRVLHALVTQTSRGEIAAVDLVNKRALDSRADIPGFTFVPVGASPKAIVVPRKNPETTYVADFGSRDVAWMPTKIFRSSKPSDLKLVRFFSIIGRPVDMVVSPDEDALFVAVPEKSAILRLSICRNPVTEEAGGNDSTCVNESQKGAITGVETLVLPSYSYQQLIANVPSTSEANKTDIASYAYGCGYAFAQTVQPKQRDFSSLFACDAGSVDAASASTSSGDGSVGSDGGVFVEAGSMDAQIGFDMDAQSSVDAGVALDTGDRSDATADAVVDAAVEGTSEAGPANATNGTGCASVAPMPVALTIDAYGEGAPRLLIADRALPVIHVIELGRFSQIASGQAGLTKPIVVGVPTTDVVVTPPVPKRIPRSLEKNDSADAGVQDAETVSTDAGVPNELDSGIDADAGLVDAGSETDAGPDGTLEPPDTGLTEVADSEVPESGTEASAAEQQESTAAMRADEVRYIYAIDATDNSVLAIDAETGLLVSVNSEHGSAIDRIGLGGAVVTSLEVLTPGYSDKNRAEPFVSKCTCIKTEKYDGKPIAPDPAYLQGVFLAASTADGSVRVVDVHDRRAVDMRECRHSECLTESGKAATNKSDEKISDMTNLAASWCSEGPTCPSNPANPPGVNSEKCVTCCNQDGGVVSLQTPNNDCVQCLNDANETIAFGDGSDCRRCLDEKGNEVAVAIRRNFARLAQIRSSAAPYTTVSFIIDGQRYVVGAGGKIRTPEEHSLSAIDSNNDGTFQCPENMAKGFPASTSSKASTSDDGGVSGRPLVCVSADPWSHTRNNWIASYEGTIPGTVGYQGRFGEPDPFQFTGETLFCSKGVMDGDLLVVTSEPRPIREIEGALRTNPSGNPYKFKPADCSRLTETRSDGTKPRVAFNIIEAYQDHLVIDSKLYNDRKPEKLPKHGSQYEFVQFCMADMLMKFDVRPKETYTVVGDSSQFLHSVYADKNDSNRCKDRQTPNKNGRGVKGALYQNATVAFMVPDEKTPPVGFGLAITLSGVNRLGLNIGSYTSSYGVSGILPVELRYSPVNQTLYAVDIAVRGLVLIPLSPFPWNDSDGIYIN